MTFKMKGSGKVYYEGSGDSINLNPNDLGKEYLDEYGNRAYDHKETKDVFYKTNQDLGGQKNQKLYHQLDFTHK